MRREKPSILGGDRYEIRKSLLARAKGDKIWMGLIDFWFYSELHEEACEWSEDIMIESLKENT
jgi:hypothetical protein